MLPKMRRRGPLPTPTLVAALMLLSVLSGSPARAEGMVGETGLYRVAGEETLLDIARHFDLGYIELRAANPELDPWLPGDGSLVFLPTGHLLPDAPHEGIVVNLGDFRLYYFPPQGDVVSLPVGSAADPYPEPMGTGRVRGKRKDPVWVPPPVVRAERPDLPASVPPGPANPLGAYALDLSWPAYAIHGTNKPDGVGRRVSHGCIRLYPEDIARLFPVVRIGTPVTIIDEPVKVGWVDDELYLEAHPSRRQADEIEASGHFTPEVLPGIDARIADAAGSAFDRIDWPLVDATLAARAGLPMPILRPLALSGAP